MAFEEIAGSPQEYFRGEIPVHVRIGICDWAERYQLIDQLWFQQSPHVEGVWPRRVQIEPYNEGGRYVQVENDSQGRIAYKKAKITLEYEPAYFNPNNMTKIFEEISATTEYTMLPAGRYMWKTKRACLGDNARIPIFMATGIWVYEVHTKNPVLGNPQPFLQILNCVNASSVTSPYFGIVFRPGTLLCQDVDCRAGGALWHMPFIRLRVRFGIRWQGWDKFWNPDYGWDQLIYLGTERPVIPYNVAPYPI